ncbi:MAG: chemotaxis protein CheW [Melioribacteraceae bacterium]|nr:chemotaxis protein CheW [Melioribacteraceae bacterium]
MENDFPMVLFSINDSVFAVSSKHVQSIVKLPDVSSIPNYPDHIRGIINLRGQIVQIADLRMMMGIKSVREDIKEFDDMMDKREQEHKSWLMALEESVEQNTSFTLTTDPHKCAFGLWYDNFETESIVLRDILERFNSPHQAIHAIAAEIEKAKHEGDFDFAREIINNTREKELSEMISLFAECKKAYKKKSQELAIIIEVNNSRIGITVDKVISVQNIEEKVITGESSEIMKINDQRLIKGIAEIENDESIIIVIDENYILNGDTVASYA